MVSVTFISSHDCCIQAPLPVLLPHHCKVYAEPSGCCHVCICMCFFANRVLQMIASLRNRKFRNSLPVSCALPSPNGPLTLPQRSLSPLLDPTQVLKSPKISLVGMESSAHCKSFRKWSVFTLLAPNVGA